MRASRWLALGAATLALLAGVLVMALSGGDAQAPPSGSTLEGTWVDRNGDGVLERGPGEALIQRTELAPRARPLRTLAVFAQLTDVHVRDEESPARAALLDRLGRPFESTFRPQEALTAQTLAAATTSINRLRPGAVLETGDLADSAQGNEFDMALAALHGGRVRPDSGAPGYDGVQEASSPDPFFYRPDVDAPRHPGLLSQAQHAFFSPGLRARWFPLLGNHDTLVQGELPPTASLRRLAVGSRLPVRLDPDLQVPRGERRLTLRLVDRVLAHSLPGRTRQVPPDQRRRQLGASEVLRRLRAASGLGGGSRPLDYSFDLGPRLRVIALDSVNRRGGAGGSLSHRQLAWLRTRLGQAGRRWVIVVSHQPLVSFPGGRAALRLLDAAPRVVAARRATRIATRSRRAGSAGAGTG